jgi:SHS2 domain-containing protein
MLGTIHVRGSAAAVWRRFCEYKPAVLGVENVMFEIFAHTADVGLRIRAPNLNALFADAGRGLFSVIVANLDDVAQTHGAEFAIEGGNLDFLLVDWLAKLLEVFETRRLLLATFEVAVTSTGLRASAKGEPVDWQRHRLEHEIKAVTYHGLKVEQVNGQWVAEAILDI